MQKPNKLLTQLVSLRGLAAWLVVFYHSRDFIQTIFPQLSPTATDILARGFMAVDFFFVLSGFIIFINYYNAFSQDVGRNVLRFYWNRLSRIYPVHLLMLLAYLLLAVAYFYFARSHTPPPALGALYFLENVFLVQAWVGNSTSWNVPAWSISAEWFVYLLFPITALAMKSIRRSIRGHVLLAAFVLGAVATVGLGLSPDANQESVLYLPLVRASYEFLLGTIIGSLYVHHYARLEEGHGLIGIAAIGLGLSCVFLNIPRYFSVPGICTLSIAWLINDKSAVTKMLNNRLLVYLGEISYSTYMVHYLVKDILKAIFITDPSQVTLSELCCSFAVVLGLSMFMHRTVEVRAQALLRTLLPVAPKAQKHTLSTETRPSRSTPH